MASVTFTSHLARAAPAPTVEAAGATLREVLDAIFRSSRRLHSSLPDEQGRLREHVGIRVDVLPVRDRVVPGEHLALGSTTRHLWGSDDGGERWRLLAGHLTPIAAVRFLPA